MKGIGAFALSVVIGLAAATGPAAAAPAERGGAAQGHGTRGAEEMHRFMNSERMPQAMSAMMAMAERMGGGDTMLGMVRMMEMMSGMGSMMGGAMRAPEQPQDRTR